MTRLHQIPYPHRFRSYEDASKFVATGDQNLCVPAFIAVGNRLEPNPEYKDAAYEYTIVPVKSGYA